MHSYDVENKIPILKNTIKYEPIPGEGTKITIKNLSGMRIFSKIRKGEE